MKKTEEAKRLTKIYEACTKVELAEEISALSSAFGAAQIRNNLSPSELNFVIIGEKKAQLGRIREAYGKIKTDEGIEQAAIELVRNQGAEDTAISDLESLERSGKSARLLEISIDTASKVMKQKQQPKGRSQ